MLKSCKYCGRIHDARYDCGRRPQRIRTQSDTEAAAFRRKQAWTKLSRQIRDRDNNLCQVCFRQLYLTNKQLTWNSISVHHIIPLEEDPDRGLDPSNLISLCTMHHELAESGYIPRDELLAIAKEQEQRAAEATG